MEICVEGIFGKLTGGGGGGGGSVMKAFISTSDDWWTELVFVVKLRNTCENTRLLGPM